MRYKRLIFNRALTKSFKNDINAHMQIETKFDFGQKLWLVQHYLTDGKCELCGTATKSILLWRARYVGVVIGISIKRWSRWPHAPLIEFIKNAKFDQNSLKPWKPWEKQALAGYLDKPKESPYQDCQDEYNLSGQTTYTVENGTEAISAVESLLFITETEAQAKAEEFNLRSDPSVARGRHTS